MHIQFRGEPQDRIVVRMAASDCLFARARILDADAGAIANPLFNLGATLVGKARVDGRAARETILVPLQNLEDLRVVLIRRKRLFQGSTDFLRDGPFDAHSLDKKTVSLVLLDGVLREEAVKVVVPNSVGDQLLPRGETVIGGVDEKLARLHKLNRSKQRKQRRHWRRFMGGC